MVIVLMIIGTRAFSILFAAGSDELRLCAFASVFILTFALFTVGTIAAPALPRPIWRSSNSRIFDFRKQSGLP